MIILFISAIVLTIFWHIEPRAVKIFFKIVWFAVKASWVMVMIVLAGLYVVFGVLANDGSHNQINTAGWPRIRADHDWY